MINGYDIVTKNYFNFNLNYLNTYRLLYIYVFKFFSNGFFSVQISVNIVNFMLKKIMNFTNMFH